MCENSNFLFVCKFFGLDKILIFIRVIKILEPDPDPNFFLFGSATPLLFAMFFQQVLCSTFSRPLTEKVFYCNFFLFFLLILNLYCVAGQHPRRAAVHHPGGGGPARRAQGSWSQQPGHGLNRSYNLIFVERFRDFFYSSRLREFIFYIYLLQGQLARYRARWAS